MLSNSIGSKLALMLTGLRQNTSVRWFEFPILDYRNRLICGDPVG